MIVFVPLLWVCLFAKSTLHPDRDNNLCWVKLMRYCCRFQSGGTFFSSSQFPACWELWHVARHCCSFGYFFNCGKYAYLGRWQRFLFVIAGGAWFEQSEWSFCWHEYSSYGVRKDYYHDLSQGICLNFCLPDEFITKCFCYRCHFQTFSRSFPPVHRCTRIVDFLEDISIVLYWTQWAVLTHCLSL